MILLSIISHLPEFISDLGVDWTTRGPRLSLSQAWRAAGGEVDPHLTDVARDQRLLLCQLTCEAVVPLAPDGPVYVGGAVHGGVDTILEVGQTARDIRSAREAGQYVTQHCSDITEEEGKLHVEHVDEFVPVTNPGVLDLGLLLRVEEQQVEHCLVLWLVVESVPVGVFIFRVLSHELV